MKKVTFGTGGPSVAAIGQGTMGIGGFFERVEDNDSEYIRLLRLGINLGMTVIDTAEVYGDGHAEELVGKAIAGVRNEVTIVTKFSAEHSSAADVIAAAERSLNRLRTDYIDVFMPHWPNPQISVEETFEALNRLVTAGKIRYIGLSNFGVADAALVGAHMNHASLACLQNEYSLIERSVEDAILPFCEQHKIALMAYSPFCQGKILSLNRRTQLLFEMAADYGISPAQLALAWLLRSTTVLAIPKTVHEEHLHANASVLTLKVDQADIDTLSIAFTISIENIATDMIDIGFSKDDRNIYKTLAEAIENRFRMVPSPMELSEEIFTSGGRLQKPIKLQFNPVSGRYNLLEGRTKYWGWVIAYGGAKPIPAIVEDFL